MKTTIKAISLAFLTMLFGLSMTACNSDDESETNKGESNKSSIDMLTADFKLKRVEWKGNYNGNDDDYSYDKYYSDYFSDFKYSNSVLTEYTTHLPEWGYLFQGSWPGENTVSYNANGTISKLSEKNSESVFQYNAEGQLIKIVQKGTGDYEYQRSSTFSYSNGILKEIVIEYNDEDGTSTSKEVFEYDENAPDNIHRQWAPGCYFHLEHEWTGLACAGLLGNASKKLPTKATTFRYNDEYIEKYSYYFNGLDLVTTVKITGHSSTSTVHLTYYTE